MGRLIEDLEKIAKGLEVAHTKSNQSETMFYVKYWTTALRTRLDLFKITATEKKNNNKGK